MADVEENATLWEHTGAWSAAGEEWSEWWGGTEAEWLAALLPRIHRYVPTGTILEIAPGHGRWTERLIGLCDRLIGVDVAQLCVDACRERFAGVASAEFHRNDGRSLAAVPDGSVDFAFSFDSLVHAEIDVIGDYLAELRRKLRPDGVAFLHHSNIGEYPRLTALAHRLSYDRRERLIERGIVIDTIAWRAESVTAAAVAEAARTAGLRPIAQELISWRRGRFLTDALSTVAMPGSRWDRELEISKNPGFGAEGRRMRRLYARAENPKRQ